MDLRSHYISMHDTLHNICNSLMRWLELTSRRCGAKQCQISGRVKNTGSLLRKVMRKQYADPLCDISDKVGTRIDLLYVCDAEAICDAIRKEDKFFKIIKYDIKSHELGADKLGYLGVNFDVIPESLPDGITSNMAKCEIQVRTIAQAAWSMAAHELVYKPPIDVPLDIQRRIYRLMALVELFDEQVGYARDSILKHKEYPISEIIQVLEEHLSKLTPPTFDDELTQVIVNAVIGRTSIDSIRALNANIERWVIDNHDKLTELYRQYNTDDRHPLLHQPEALLIFYILDRGNRYELQQKWQDQNLPFEQLNALSGIWGDPIG